MDLRYKNIINHQQQVTTSAENKKIQRIFLTKISITLITNTLSIFGTDKPIRIELTNKNKLFIYIDLQIKVIKDFQYF